MTNPNQVPIPPQFASISREMQMALAADDTKLMLMDHFKHRVPPPAGSMKSIQMFFNVVNSGQVPSQRERILSDEIYQDNCPKCKAIRSEGVPKTLRRLWLVRAPQHTPDYADLIELLVGPIDKLVHHPVQHARFEKYPDIVERLIPKFFKAFRATNEKDPGPLKLSADYFHIEAVGAVENARTSFTTLFHSKAAAEDYLRWVLNTKPQLPDMSDWYRDSLFG